MENFETCILISLNFSRINQTCFNDVTNCEHFLGDSRMNSCINSRLLAVIVVINGRRPAHGGDHNYATPSDKS